MATPTVNRGIADAALFNVVRREIEDNLVDPPPTTLSDLNIVGIETGESRVLDLTWMRDFTMMKEWVGEREEEHARELFASRMSNRKFQDTITFDIEDIEDDLGMLNPTSKAQALQNSYEKRIRYEESAYLRNAFNKNYIQGSQTLPNGATIYFGSMDGEPLLSDSHPYYNQIEFNENAPRGQRVNIVDGGTFSNLVNVELTEDNLWAARETFQKYVDFNGEPMGVSQPDTLVVPPDLERTAVQILERARKLDDSSAGAAVDNETQGLFDVYVDRRLTGTVDGVDITFGGTDYTDQSIDLSNVWYLIDTDAPAPPFMRWNRTDLQLQQLAGTPDITEGNPAEGTVDPHTFDHDELKIGGRARFGMSFGLPQAIYGSLGNTTLS